MDTRGSVRNTTHAVRVDLSQTPKEVLDITEVLYTFGRVGYLWEVSESGTEVLYDFASALGTPDAGAAG